MLQYIKVSRYTMIKYKGVALTYIMKTEWSQFLMVWPNTESLIVTEHPLLLTLANEFIENFYNMKAL